MRRAPVWQVVLIIAGIISAVCLAAAGLFLLLTREAPASGGAYTEAMAGSPQALTPLLAAFNDPDRDLTSLLFSGLTRLQKDGALQPDLADSWQVSEDGKTYTFRLRGNAEWHDGRPVSADDAVFTFQTLGSKDLPTDPELVALWAQVKPEKVDPSTVRLTLAQPFAPFLSYTTIGLAPSHLLRGVAPKDIAAAAKNAVGSGPFRLKDASLERVMLEANPKAYNGRPLLDALDFRFFKDDASVAAALVAGQVDGALLYPSVGKDVAGRVRATPTVTMRPMSRGNATVLFLNAVNPLFQNKSLRQALSYGVNREGLVDTALDGFGRPADGPIAPDWWAYNGDVKRYEFNPEQAGKLLDDAGWKAGGSGIREKEGQPLRFSLLTNNDKGRVAVGEALARDYKRLGIQVDLQASGITGLMQNFLIPRKYESILFGMESGYDPDPYPYWHSTQATAEGLNVASYGNPDVDKLLERGRTTTNTDERKQLYAQFQQRFAEEMPSIVLYYPLYVYAQAKRVRGVEVAPLYDTSSRFYNIKNWYTETQRVLGP